MNIQLTARALEGAEEYLPFDNHSLRAEILPPSPGCPEETQIRITADKPFEGVIRIALGTDKPAAALPRFFLPGFMYGTNRGEAPLVVDSKAPRLRTDEAFPCFSLVDGAQRPAVPSLRNDVYRRQNPRSCRFSLLYSPRQYPDALDARAVRILRSVCGIRVLPDGPGGLVYAGL